MYTYWGKEVGLRLWNLSVLYGWPLKQRYISGKNKKISKKKNNRKMNSTRQSIHFIKRNKFKHFFKPFSSSTSFGLVLWRKFLEKNIEEKHIQSFYKKNATFICFTLIASLFKIGKHPVCRHCFIISSVFFSV